MALRSFDSQTRLGIPRPSKAFITEHRGEILADEGTLIMEPAPVSVAPVSAPPPSSRPMTIPPPPPSSMRPMVYSVPPASSVRPSMPSWDASSGWSPAHEITASTRLPAKRQASTRERSASAMLIIATAAMLAALASIGFMHKARHADGAGATAAAAQPVAKAVATPVVAPESNAATIPAPPSAPIAPPVPAAIDIDDAKDAKDAKDANDAKPATSPAAPKPVVARPTTPVPAASPAAPAPAPVRPVTPAKPVKEKPSQAAQQKALEDLLDQLGEEQLKR